MSRFNAPMPAQPGSAPTVNDAGGAAFDRSDKAALASMILTSTLRDSFYKSANAQMQTVRQLCYRIAREGDLAFVAKAALFARHEYGLRSISHVLAGEVAYLRSQHHAQRGDWGPRFFERVVFRLDDMSQIAAYWISTHAAGRTSWTLPKAMQRGFARVFAGASARNLAKWNKAGSPSLRQLAHLVHPKGEKDSVLYNLRAGKLRVEGTWEAELSKAGTVGEAEDVALAKGEAWTSLFAAGKVKYLAALRNARNVIEQAPDAVPALCELLRSQRDVLASKTLPFQFLSAHEVVSGIPGPLARQVLAAIEDGAQLSIPNVPSLPGSTLIALDDSGSMATHVVKGAMFASALARASKDCDVMLFSDDARYVALSPNETLFGGVRALVAKLVPAGTNYYAVFQRAKRPYDRIIFLSDAQGWMNGGQPQVAHGEYRRRTGANPSIIAWDLAGSETAMFPERKLYQLAGMSDKAFEILGKIEQDPRALIAAIEAYAL